MRALLIPFLLLWAADTLTIKVYPQVIMAGQGTRVTCRVPLIPNPSSFDTIEIGIEGYRTTVLEVHGTPWTVEQVFTKIPCDIESAFCALVLEKETRIVRQPLIMAGCGK